ncbi:MAG: CinA family nicotinamide mononucleotide deamidase-related protein [Elusimicrobia bacterium]|nr:CinA family nicotinamide mononucleotide deamidase-related protein [Elusimicrobiota bacterium]
MNRPRLELICVGSELLNGHLNTHQSYISLRLKSAGLELSKASTLPDDLPSLREEIRACLKRCDALLLCGGLGPTFDDVTRQAAAEALGRKLVYRPALYSEIRKKFRRHRMAAPRENRRQAYVIEGAEVLPNGTGSAPGQLLAVPREKMPWPQAVALMPGPFAELSPMFESRVLGFLRKTYGRGIFARHLVAHLSGLPESVADQRLAFLTKNPRPGEAFTILASAGQVDFHATTTAATPGLSRKLLERIRQGLYAAVGPRIFAEGSETLESTVGRLLKRRGQTLATAESCTGGLLGARLTSTAGSSSYFLGGIVAYSNELKTRLLGVRPETLARRGTVSSACAREMAESVRRMARASWGLSITGIAGPGGGTPDKPIGLVFVGLCGGEGKGKHSRAWKLSLSGERETIRQRAAGAALHLLLSELNAQAQE